MNIWRMIGQLVPDTSLGAVAIMSKDGDKAFKTERGGMCYQIRYLRLLAGIPVC